MIRIASRRETFHDFHLAWIAESRRALNSGLLPRGYYALAEQVAGDIIPDVLMLQRSQDDSALDGLREDSDGGTDASVLTVTDSPPRVSVTATTHEAITVALRRRQIVIRHATGDRIVALIEIVSPGNKESQPMLRAFLEKSAAALQAGYHLLLLDLWPPGNFDPAGIHGALWADGRRHPLPPTRRSAANFGGVCRARARPGHRLCRTAQRGRATAGYATVSGARALRQCAVGAYVSRGVARSPRTLAAGHRIPGLAWRDASALDLSSPSSGSKSPTPVESTHPRPSRAVTTSPQRRRIQSNASASPIKVYRAQSDCGYQSRGPCPIQFDTNRPTTVNTAASVAGVSGLPPTPHSRDETAPPRDRRTSLRRCSRFTAKTA